MLAGELPKFVSYHSATQQGNVPPSALPFKECTIGQTVIKRNTSGCKSVAIQRISLSILKVF
jgi:hypothetical protein